MTVAHTHVETSALRVLADAELDLTGGTGNVPYMKYKLEHVRAGTDVAMEELVIVHEGLRREP